MQHFPARAPRFLVTSILGTVLLWPGGALAQVSHLSSDVTAMETLRNNIRDHQAMRNYARRLAEGSDVSPAEAEHLRNVAERNDRLAEADQKLLEYIEQDFNEAWARESIPVILDEYATEQEAQRQGHDSASQRLDQAGEGGKRGQRFAEMRARDSGVVIVDGRTFHRVIVDSTGEVIVNDRADVIEAKLEDLGRRQEDLQARAGRTTGAAAQKRLRAELAALDREIMAVLDKLARNGRAGPAICTPPKVTYAITGCDYLALNVPIRIPRGDGAPIVIEKALLEISERERGPWQWSFRAEYTQGRSRGTLDAAGSLKVNANGNNTMLRFWTDGEGNRQVRKIPLQLDVRGGRAEGLETILGLDGPLPRLDLTFRRDPANFPADQRPDLRMPAMSSPAATAQQPAPGTASTAEDDFVVPLIEPQKPAPPKSEKPDPARAVADEVSREAKRRASEAARRLLRGKLF